MNRIIVGVDEAGRGPVIGPLVICAYAVDADKEAELKKTGVKDSKMLSALQREKLAVELKKGIYVLKSATAAEITEVMQRKVSLNEYEAQVIGELLTKLEKTTAFQTVYVDSPDPIPSKFATRIRKYYAGNAEIVAENKADVTYPVASAASIVAKVERDAEIRKIEKIIGEFGSGYPADPNTKKFLEKHHTNKNAQEYIRHEWATVKNLKEKAQQKGLSEF
ncbi:MAG: ribonuclease HII [Candidatus Micrarchaeota archaeon]